HEPGTIAIYTLSLHDALPIFNQWYHQYGEAGTREAVFRYAKGYTKANVKVSWVPGTGNEYPDKVHAALLGTQLTFTIAFVYPLRSEEHTSELQSLAYLVCRLL